MLHRSLSPCTGYQLQLASSSRHWFLHIEQPQVQHPPTSTHYYESTSGGMIFPLSSGMLDPCQSSSNNWKLISFDITWLHPKLKKKIQNCNLSLYLSLLPLLACTYLNNVWNWCYEHFLCLFASSKLIAWHIPHLDKSVCKMTKYKCPIDSWIFFVWIIGA